MNKLVLALLVATMISLPVAVTAAPQSGSMLLAQREGSPNTRSGGDSSDELRAFYQKEMTALRKEVAAMRQEMSAMRSEIMAAMKGNAMKGDAMKGDAMSGDAMKNDSMMKKP